ncbi:MAG: hypothetical protein E7039_09090 [Lentisphaerae bacterium]|nr:hypothetical protein [Lentisphaerota bacterium]
MKKIVAATVTLLWAVWGITSEFALTCQLAKNVYTQGEDVVMSATAVYPDGYKPYLWRAYLNARKVPADFCEKTGAYNNNHKTYPEIFITRGGVQVKRGYFRYPAVAASGEKTNISFSSKNWPAGDYVVTIQTLFVHKNPAELKDRKKQNCYKETRIRFTIEAPDARISPEEMLQKQPLRSDFTVAGTGSKAAVQTLVRNFFHNGNFYFQIEALEPAMSKLTADRFPPDSGAIWRNDSVELSIASEPGAAKFYKFIIDCSGQSCDMLLTDNNTNKNIYNVFSDYQSKADFKVERRSDRWIVNAVIPAASMADKLTSPDSFRFNVVRHRRAGGKLVTSTMVKLEKHGLNYPLEFAKLPAVGFDKTLYNVKLEKTLYAYRNPGKLDLSTVLNCGDTKLNLVKIVFTLSGKNGRFEKTLLQSIRKNSAHTIQTQMNGMSDGEYVLEYSIYTNAVKPLLLYTGKTAVDLQYNPLSLKIITPAYRDCIFATMPDKTLSFEVISQLTAPQKLTAVLSGEKSTLKQNFTAENGKNFLSFDMSKLPDGKYDLQIYSQNKIVLSRQIRKLPYRKGEVWLDKNGVTYVDGVKTLPFGWIGNQPYEPDKSLNLLLEYITFSDAEHGRKHIAENLRTGQRSIIYFTQEFTGKAWDKADIFAENARKGRFSDIQKNKVTEVVNALSGEEGLFAWYLADEPEGRNHSPLFYEEAAALLRKLDPYHPAIMLNYGLHGIKRFYKSCDILMPDCYPQYFEDDSTAKPRTATADWVKTASALRPSWFCPQMTMWPARSADGKLRGIAPDYRDQRMQFLQALICNAKGFALYTYYRSQIFSSMIIGHVELGQTLQMLKDYLLENTLINEVKAVNDIPGLRFGLKKYGDKYCLIVVNTDSKVHNVKLQFATLKEHTFYEAGGNGVCRVEKGVITDRFEPKQSKIYISDKVLASQVPQVAEIEKRIAELTASRKKKGNLIGTGELFEAQYRDMYKKNIYPENITRIKASSEKPNYTTAGMGTLYFLLDGLTEPTWADFAWTPAADDTAPYIELKLPRAEAVEKMVLYTPGRTLARGRVIVNGNIIPFDGTGKKVVEISWKKQISDTVKIEFERQGATPEKGPYSQVFLSEIELY